MTEILTTVPFALDLNLGREYNAAFERLPADGWACLLDHDMMFTTTSWRRQLQEAIAVQPDGIFTAITNRMASRWQVAPEAGRGDDMVHHRKVGAARLLRRTLLDVTETQGWGGVLMLISKRAWRDAGGFVDGLLCVDHCFHYAAARAGRRVWLIEGLYVYHFRGTSGGSKPPGPEIPHARDKDGCGCPCREIPHGDPRFRVRLP